MDFIVDRSPAKHSKFSPGTCIKVTTTDTLLKENISWALLLAWNFSSEIIQQQKEFIDRGGKFIIPLPKVREVS